MRVIESQTDKVSLWGGYPTKPKNLCSHRPVATLSEQRIMFFLSPNLTSLYVTRGALNRSQAQMTQARNRVQTSKKSGQFRHETRSVSRLLARARTVAWSGNRIPLKDSVGAYGAQQRQSFALRSLLCRLARIKLMLNQNTTW
jgi:hypothetical protein